MSQKVHSWVLSYTFKGTMASLGRNRVCHHTYQAYTTTDALSMMHVKNVIFIKLKNMCPCWFFYRDAIVTEYKFFRGWNKCLQTGHYMLH